MRAKRQYGDSSPDPMRLFRCPLRHNTTLQHYRLLSVTKPSGERTSENPVQAKFGEILACELRRKRVQESAASIAAAVCSPIDGIQCEYLSRVIAMLLWPSNSWTSLGCTPRESKRVAAVSLRS